MLSTLTGARVCSVTLKRGVERIFKFSEARITRSQAPVIDDPGAAVCAPNNDEVVVTVSYMLLEGNQGKTSLGSLD